MGIRPTSQWVGKLRNGPLGIHVQTMENRRTLARLLPHGLAFLPVPHGKASGCCSARRGSRWQTRKELRHQRRQRISLGDNFNASENRQNSRRWDQRSVVSTQPPETNFGENPAPGTSVLRIGYEQAIGVSRVQGLPWNRPQSMDSV
jgi:hypothetical protein